MQSALLYRWIFLLFCLVWIGLTAASMHTMSWSLKPGMQVMLGIRVGLDARTRSNMLSCLVGSVTSSTRLKSLSMSSKLSYTVLHVHDVQSGLIDC